MNVPSQPCINRHENYQLLCRKYERELALLRKELAMYNTLANHTQICYEPLSESQIKDVQLQVRQFIDGDLEEIEIVNIRQTKEIFEQFKQIVLCSEKQWETKGKGSKKSENRDSAEKGDNFSMYMRRVAHEIYNSTILQFSYNFSLVVANSVCLFVFSLCFLVTNRFY